LVSLAWQLAAGLVLVFDQVSKNVAQRRGARARSRAGERLAAWWRVRHTRTLLGLLRGRRVLVAVWIVATLGTIVLVQCVAAFQELPAQIGLGAAVGGATSNMLDMVRKGVVVDFVDLGIWPVFNLADVGIVLGVAVALWSAA
jgi:lipoprotein signal peptidase